MTAGLSLGGVGLLAGLAGCADSLDWRELQPPGLSLVVALPCKPASHTRTVPLAGRSVQMTLLACSVEGHTFALASADVEEPGRVGLALKALADAAVANVGGSVTSELPATVPGMTPNPAARHWRLSGRLPDGQAVAEQLKVFAHGTRVYQATLLGPRADDALAAPFFGAIKVLP